MKYEVCRLALSVTLFICSCFRKADTKAELHSSVAQIALKYAEQKERTLAFNYAVLAWNNSFFLDNLVCALSSTSRNTCHLVVSLPSDSTPKRRRHPRRSIRENTPQN